MSKAKEILNELKHLDQDIQCRLDEIASIEASLLSSPKLSKDRVQSNNTRKLDDVYVQLITMRDEIEQDTAKVISRRLELAQLINRLSDPKYRMLLRMIYINKESMFDVCESLEDISVSSFYRLKKEAIAELERLIVNESK